MWHTAFWIYRIPVIPCSERMPKRRIPITLRLYLPPRLSAAILLQAVFANFTDSTDQFRWHERKPELPYIILMNRLRRWFRYAARFCRFCLWFFSLCSTLLQSDPIVLAPAFDGFDCRPDGICDRDVILTFIHQLKRAAGIPISSWHIHILPHHTGGARWAGPPFLFQ